jgi:hypothetical protein
MSYQLDRLTAGLSRNAALTIFVHACDRPDTLWVTESWFKPRVERLHRLLSDPVTNDQALALCDAALKRHPLDGVLEWLEHAPEMGWRMFTENKARVADELKRTEQEQRLREHLVWIENMKAWPRPACPQCDTTEHVVPIVYGLPEQPILPTMDAFIRGGCVIKAEQWFCQACSCAVTVPS